MAVRKYLSIAKRTMRLKMEAVCETRVVLGQTTIIKDSRNNSFRIDKEL